MDTKKKEKYQTYPLCYAVCDDLVFTAGGGIAIFEVLLAPETAFKILVHRMRVGSRASGFRLFLCLFRRLSVPDSF